MTGEGVTGGRGVTVGRGATAGGGGVRVGEGDEWTGKDSEHRPALSLRVGLVGRQPGRVIRGPPPSSLSHVVPADPRLGGPARGQGPRRPRPGGSRPVGVHIVVGEDLAVGEGVVPDGPPAEVPGPRDVPLPAGPPRPPYSDRPPGPGPVGGPSKDREGKRPLRTVPDPPPLRDRPQGKESTSLTPSLSKSLDAFWCVGPSPSRH